MTYQFKNQFYKQKALIHRSYAQEHKIPYDYDRLEFLGDSVLKTATCEYLFHKFKHLKEGDLSKWRNILCSQEVYAKMALKMELQKKLLLGEDHEHLRTQERILCCIFEAYWGAVFVDSSYEEMKEHFLKFFELFNQEEGHFFEKNLEFYDPISTFQEYMLETLGTLPQYLIKEKKGLFSGTLSFDGMTFENSGYSSKKKLIKSLAQKALDYVNSKSTSSK